MTILSGLRSGSHSRVTTAQSDTSTKGPRVEGPTAPSGSTASNAAARGFGVSRVRRFGLISKLEYTPSNDIVRFVPKETGARPSVPDIEPIVFNEQILAPNSFVLRPNLAAEQTCFTGTTYWNKLLVEEVFCEADAPDIFHMINDQRSAMGIFFKTPIEADRAFTTLLYASKLACADFSAVRPDDELMPDDLHKALSHLPSLKPLMRIADLRYEWEGGPRPDIVDPKTLDLAWRIAYKLAVTDHGVTLFKALTNLNPAIDRRDSQEDHHNRQIRQHLNLTHFLQGADLVLKDHAALQRDRALCGEPVAAVLGAEPATLLRHCYDACDLYNERTNVRYKQVGNTLLAEGMTQLQTAIHKDCVWRKPPLSEWQRRCEATVLQLKLNQQNLDDIGTGPYRNQPDGGERLARRRRDIAIYREALFRQKVNRDALCQGEFAYRMMLNGYRSDARGSPLWQINKQAGRLEKYFKRAQKHADLPFYKKLPINLVDTLRTRQKKPLDVKQSLPTPQVVDSANLQREKIQQALGILGARISTHGGPWINGLPTQLPPLSIYKFSTDSANKFSTLRNIARAELIKVWLSRPLHDLGTGLPLREWNVAKLYSPGALKKMFVGNPICEPGNADEFNALQRQMQDFLQRGDGPDSDSQNLILTPELLDSWARQLGLHDEEPLFEPFPSRHQFDDDEWDELPSQSKAFVEI
jgi:hypothetical protein